MKIRRYLQIVLIDVLSLFHRSVIVVLKSINFDFKTTITAMIGDVSDLGWFPWHAFSKSRKIYIELYFLKEKFNKMEINMDSENESQLKRIRKPPLLLSQEESLVKKEISLPVWQKLKNVQRKRCFSKNFPDPKPLKSLQSLFYLHWKPNFILNC